MNETVPVTAWHLLNTETKRFGFNHIEDGHAQGEKPLDRFGHKWHKSTWRKQLALLVSQGPGQSPKLKLL